MADFIGFDGDATIGTQDCVTIKTWSADISRTIHDVGGFNQSGRKRKPGKFDIQGSFGGVGKNGSTNPITMLSDGSTVAITLTFHEATTTNDSKIAFDALVSGVSMGSTHDGEMTITGNLQLSSAAVRTSTPWVLTWSP